MSKLIITLPDANEITRHSLSKQKTVLIKLRIFNDYLLLIKFNSKSWASLLNFQCSVNSAVDKRLHQMSKKRQCCQLDTITRNILKSVFVFLFFCPLFRETSYSVWFEPSTRSSVCSVSCLFISAFGPMTLSEISQNDHEQSWIQEELFSLSLKREISRGNRNKIFTAQCQVCTKKQNVKKVFLSWLKKQWFSTDFHVLTIESIVSIVLF